MIRPIDPMYKPMNPSGFPVNIKDRSLPFLSLLGLVVLLLGSGCSTSPKMDQDEQESQRVVLSSDPVKRISQWKHLIEQNQSVPAEEKLVLVNNFFNQLDFVDDATHWGREDYWATPAETLVSNGGDCEDFTIAKYFTLRRMEIPERKVRLTYVKSLTLNQPHMVLSYFHDPTAEPLVLDNLVKTIVPASDRLDLVPVYSFNGNGIWLAKRRDYTKRLRDSSDLRLWQDLLKRMRRDGQTIPSF